MRLTKRPQLLRPIPFTRFLALIGTHRTCLTRSGWSTQRRRHAAALATLLLFTILAAPASRAADPETEAAKVLGKGLSQAFAGESGVVTDPLLTQWVDRVGAKLVAVSPRHNLPYHFTILNTAEPNAFTLPGGYIYVTSGLLDFLRSRDELAGVMGHEVGHVVGHHPIRTIELELGAALAVHYGPLPHGAAATALEDGVVFLGTLAYSRHNESIADHYGIRFSTEAGYDPSGLIQFLESFGANPRPSFFDRYLANHPPDIQRIRALERTKYMNHSDWQLQETIADRLMANCRPAAALIHYQYALGAHRGDPELLKKLTDAAAECGGGPVLPASTTTLPPAGLDPGLRPVAPTPPEPTRPSGVTVPPINPEPTAPPLSPTPGRAPQRQVISPEGPLTLAVATTALKSVRSDSVTRVQHTARTLQQLRKIQFLNGNLQDALLGAAPTRLGNIRWIVLAYQAFGDVNRLEDVYARVAQVDRNLLAAIADMQSEIGTAPAVEPPSDEIWAAGIKLAAETGVAGARMSDATVHMNRGALLLAGVLANLNSVYLGIGNDVGNVRFAATQAALLAGGREIETGRRLSGEALASLALAQDRVLLVQMNRLGSAASPERQSIYDCNTAELLGVDAARVRDLRTAGESYGGAVYALALSIELRRPTTVVEQRYKALRAFSAASSPPQWPVSWVDSAVDQGGSPAFLEIMLRQVVGAMREEASCA